METEFENFLKQELREIKTKLDNHIAHIVGDISAIKTDIQWLKGTIKNGNGNGKESKDDIKSQQDVDWLKRFFWLQVGLVITLIGLMIQHLMFAN
jgi:hypothetical protein